MADVQPPSFFLRLNGLLKRVNSFFPFPLVSRFSIGSLALLPYGCSFRADSPPSPPPRWPDYFLFDRRSLLEFDPPLSNQASEVVVRQKYGDPAITFEGLCEFLARHSVLLCADRSSGFPSQTLILAAWVFHSLLFVIFFS